jgi:hypothetical protein
MDVVSNDPHERLRRAHHDAAVAADQERSVPRLSKAGLDALADAVPGDPGPRPAPDRGNRVMGKIAGNRDIAVVDDVAADCAESLEQPSAAIGFRVVLAAQAERAGPEGDSQDVVRTLGPPSMLGHLCSVVVAADPSRIASVRPRVVEAPGRVPSGGRSRRPEGQTDTR